MIIGLEYKVNEHITIRQPSVKEICEYGEQKYYNMVNAMCATPADYQLPLSHLGCNYQDVSEFELFSNLCRNYMLDDTKILFGDLNFRSFELMEDTFTGQVVLYNEKDNIAIDKASYDGIVNYLRDLHCLKKNAVPPRYRYKQQPYSIACVSVLPSLVYVVKKSEQYGNTYESIGKLPIYTLLYCLKMITGQYDEKCAEMPYSKKDLCDIIKVIQRGG